MKSKAKASKTDLSLQKLSLSIGNFIRYWGFRRIHGAIWAQMYLSKTPLSCTDLTVKLGLSKALISPALEELCRYKLIFEAPAPNEKTKMYQAADDINEVIKNVLKERESKMLKQIAQDFSSFKKSEAAHKDIDKNRLNSLEEMIFSANLMLEIMIDQKNLMKLPTEFDL
jgi:DNA-binding transcriptional regulator GbsR (MarR family)